MVTRQLSNRPTFHNFIQHCYWYCYILLFWQYSIVTAYFSLSILIMTVFLIVCTFCNTDFFFQVSDVTCVAKWGERSVESWVVCNSLQHLQMQQPQYVMQNQSYWSVQNWFIRFCTSRNFDYNYACTGQSQAAIYKVCNTFKWNGL